MTTTLLAAMSGILMVSAISNHAEARQIHNMRHPHLQDLMAVSPYPAAPIARPNDLPLRGPTDGGTATGGPSGGPNQG